MRLYYNEVRTHYRWLYMVIWLYKVKAEVYERRTHEVINEVIILMRL